MAKLPQELLQRPIAHRGFHDVLSGVAENSPASFQAAIDAGFGIELDLQRSKDGEAMVFHDYDMTRLTGQSGPIQLRTAAELREIDLLIGGEGIPTLTDVLTLVAGRVPLLVEIKDQDGALGANVGPLEKRVAEVLHAYQGPVAVMAFNPYSVNAFGACAPDIPRGLTTGDLTQPEWEILPRARTQELTKILEYDSTGSCFISHGWRSLDTQPVLDLKARGVPVLCWTVKDAAQEAEARVLADNITFEGYTPVNL